MTVAFHLVTQGPDHLRVAEVAALADVDVTSGEFEGSVGPNPVHLFDGVLEIEQGHDLDDAADGDHEQHTDHKKNGILLESGVAEEASFRSSHI